MENDPRTAPWVPPITVDRAKVVALLALVLVVVLVVLVIVLQAINGTYS